MKRIIVILSLLMFSWSVIAAQTGRTITIPHHKSVQIKLQGKADKVSLGDPEVLDIVILKSSELFLIGKKLGSTNLSVWDRSGRLIETLNIEVSHDLNNLKAKLYEFLPDETIKVHSSKKKLILSGQISNQEKMNLALKIAETYAGGLAADSDAEKQVNTSSIINLMTIGGAQQVMLEVTVAEVQRTLTKRFESNFNFFQNNGNFDIGGGTVGGNFVTENSVLKPVFGVPSFETSGLLGSFVDGDTLFTLALDIAKDSGVAKVLAEPNLTTLSGSKAEFLAGGEFPIPVPDEDGITIDYRKFGVGVNFIPTVLSDKKINLNMSVSVSELSSSNAISLSGGISNATYIIPALTIRSASSTLELADGQTIGIAGLLSENTREKVGKVPGLGDIPILGQLFTSKEYVSGETELVILVTPRLAKPIDRSKVTLPTDGFVAPSDVEFYLLGKNSHFEKQKRMVIPNQADQAVPVSTETGGSEGTFGHSL